MKLRKDSSLFYLDHGKLALLPGSAGVARELSALSPIDSQEKFNRYAQAACRVWSECFPGGLGRTSADFERLMERVGKGGPGVIQTGWGGVVVTRHEHPRVEKYLAVRQGCYLALEMHEKKEEFLEVKEGAGLILWREAPNESLTVEALRPGGTFYLGPGREHCLIGTENLLVFEQSIDPEGMDQDLIFLFEPEAEATEPKPIEHAR